MQQGCYEMYGMSVEKSMIMRMNSEMVEPMELIHHAGSNERTSPPPLQSCSGDEDGNSSENQNRSPPTSCENSTMDEPKTAKKRRKQSNPLRYQTTPEMPPLLEESQRGGEAEEALDLHTKPEELRCHHCSGVFDTEDLLKVHVEEEHVQKVLERQLQQQSYNKSTSGNSSSSEVVAKEATTKPEMALQQISPVGQSSPSEGLLQDARDSFKNPHFPFPPMPPFIPFSRSGDGDSKPGNIPIPLSMFPNPITPFLFPVIPQGQTPPVSNGNSHSGGGQGVRIFNLEAYCELCNKEFCNKYFLKTHKANKHGIYSVESIVSSPYGGQFLQSSLNSPIPLPHPLQTPGSDPLPTRSGLFNMESYCEICQKEFCNKYFLKKHRQKIHGIVEPGQNISPSTTPSQDTKSNSPVMTTTAALSLTSAPSFGGGGGGSSSDKTLEDAGRDIPISKMEFPSLFNLQNHTKSIVPAVPPPTSSSSSSCPPVTSAASLQSPLQQGSSNDSLVSHVFTPETLREMGVINADAFCELCCKEFCNKYFLRTHKLNKHGINMPEISPSKPGSGTSQPPSSHSQGSQSGDKPESIFDEARMQEELLHESQAFENATGELSCDFCNRPFSSLYLLKMHKFYTHNIPYIKEESKSKPNSPTAENGQENKENEFVKPHLPLSLPPTSLISESIPTSLQEDAASQDLQKLQSMIRELNASAGSESNKIVCNLCRLEFDNKYFLRAHMMNEHGVLPNEDGHVPGHSAADFGIQSKLSSADGASDYQRLSYTNASSSSVDSEAYCEICQKEFCSKYFLKTHKQNIHGFPVDMSSAPKKSLADEVCQIKTIVNNTLSSSVPPPASNSLLMANAAASTTTIASSSSSGGALPPLPSQIPVITSHNPSHVSSPLVPTFSTSGAISSTSNAISSVIHVSHLPSNLSVPKLALPAPPSVAAAAPPPMAPPPHLPSLQPHPVLSGLEKPRNLTGRNYCNICNKELCNKYFMKTHMLKMHGINLDSQPHEAARISTIGGVQCDICQKELCSKYFLKVHKQNTHGIFEEGAQQQQQQGKEARDHPPFPEKEQPLQGLDLSDPSGRYFSHYPEICPVCNCRFKSIKWLKAHMMSDHGNILKENFSHNNSGGGGSNALLPADSSNNVDGSCLCVICGQGFPDKVALHVHLIKDHHSPTEELGVGTHSGIKTSTADSPALMVPDQGRVNGTSSPGSAAPKPHHPHHPKPHGGSRIYHCSFCVYSTRWLSNLYAHEKRHTGVNAEGEKKFVCRVCHRAYRYNHSLQRHFLSHRAAGLNVKELSHPLVLASPHHHPPWNSFFKKGGAGENGPQSSSSSKIKRYRCSKCNKKFRSRELCLAHIHATHGGKRGGLALQKSAKPFRCRFCGFATRAWNVLKIHITRQHHGDPEATTAAEKTTPAATAEEKPEATPPPCSSPRPDGFAGLPPPPPNSPHLPMTFAMPQNPPTAGSFIMQPFLLAQPECDGVTRNGTFVPSLVYLPVCQKVSQPMTVAFTLTPA